MEEHCTGNEQLGFVPAASADRNPGGCVAKLRWQNPEAANAYGLVTWRVNAMHVKAIEKLSKMEYVRPKSY